MKEQNKSLLWKKKKKTFFITLYSYLCYVLSINNSKKQNSNNQDQSSPQYKIAGIVRFCKLQLNLYISSVAQWVEQVG